MADDTRQSQSSRTPSEGATPPRPQEPANIMPGGTANTAGGTLVDFTIGDAVKSIKLEDFKTIHQKPCARDGLLMGIGSGFAAGGIAVVLGRPVWKAANFAVAGFCLSSLGAYQYCQYRRGIEKAGMKRAVEIMDRKKADMLAKREIRRKAKVEADRLEKEQRKEEERRRSWKFWLEKNLKFW